MTFAGGTPDDPGDFDGTGTPTTLFTVSGVVALRLLAVCTASLTGATATIEVGTAASPNSLLPTTNGTNIDIGETWLTAGPTAAPALLSDLAEVIISNADIIQSVNVANINAGSIEYYALWAPISPDASLTAA